MSAVKRAWTKSGMLRLTCLSRVVLGSWMLQMFTGRGGCKDGDGEDIKRVFTMWEAPNTAE